MSGADQLFGMTLPSRIKIHTLKHLERIGRAADKQGVLLAVERAEGFVEGLEVSGALNPGTIEALYVAVDGMATERLAELDQ